MKKHNKEYNFLISLCKSSETYPLDLLIRELKNINWGELIDSSIRHNMLATLSHHIVINYVKLSAEGLLNYHLGNFFIREKTYTHYLKDIMIDNALRISGLFKKEGVSYVINKGIVLETHVHFGDGRRDLGSDIDFMILPEDRTKAFNILKGTGAIVGKYDTIVKQVIEHSREEILTYKFNPDHLLRFTLKTNKDFIDYIDIDVANSITWHNSEMQVPMEMAFEDIESIEVMYDGVPHRIKKFNITFEFLFVVMHLYREAWFYKRTSKWNSDVNLKKFFDVYQYLSKYKKIIFNDTFYKKMDALGFLKPFKWVVMHTDNVFDSDFSKNLDTSDIDEKYLYGAFESQGKITHWKGEMKERLFEKDRSKLFLNN